MKILSVNAGSSSLKVAVFDESAPDTPETSISIEGIGTPDSCLIPDGSFGSDGTRRLPIESQDAAAELFKEWLEEELNIHPSDVSAIGYRVVHGGPRYTEAVKVTEEVTDYLESITPLAPNHMPGTLASIRACLHAYPETHHVVVFDTSFFGEVPEVAKTLPLPKEIRESGEIRRYGFHGLSYQSLLDSFSKNEGEEAAKGRVIMAHLGSGASVSACLDGKPLDMSMGFTPVSGIMMSTRTGDLEPGVISYLQKEKGLSIDEISEMMTHKSGLLGVSGTTADMYTLLHSQDNPDVALAISLFCYKIKKQIGAYTAVLGGVDSIIFSGGIGERSAEIRARVLEGLEFLGVHVDDERNQENGRKISTDDSRVSVHVIQAREDVSIVQQTLSVIK